MALELAATGNIIKFALPTGHTLATGDVVSLRIAHESLDFVDVEDVEVTVHATDPDDILIGGEIGQVTFANAYDLISPVADLLQAPGGVEYAFVDGNRVWLFELVAIPIGTFEVYWRGWIIPQDINEQIETFPYVLSLTAVDGLALLNGDSIPTQEMEGSATLFNTIHTSLRATGIESEIWVNTNIRTTQMPQEQENVLTTTSVNNYAFYRDGFVERASRLEAIEECLTFANMNVFQSYGRWFLVSNSAYSDQITKDEVLQSIQDGSGVPTDIRQRETNRLLASDQETIRYQVYDHLGNYLRTELDSSVLYPTPTRISYASGSANRNWRQGLRGYGVSIRKGSIPDRAYSLNPIFDYGVEGWESFDTINYPLLVTDTNSLEGERSLRINRTASNTSTDRWFRTVPITTFTRTENIRVRFGYLFDFVNTAVQQGEIRFRVIINTEDFTVPGVAGTHDKFVYNFDRELWEPLRDTDTGLVADKWRVVQNSSPLTWHIHTEDLPSPAIINVNITDMRLELFGPSALLGNGTPQIGTTHMRTFVDIISIGPHLEPEDIEQDYLLLREERQQINTYETSLTSRGEDVYYGKVDQTQFWRYRDFAARSMEEISLWEKLNDFRNNLEDVQITVKGDVPQPLAFHHKIWINFPRINEADAQSSIIDSMIARPKANTFDLMMHVPNQDNDVAATFFAGDTAVSRGGGEGEQDEVNLFLNFTTLNQSLSAEANTGLEFSLGYSVPWRITVSDSWISNLSRTERTDLTPFSRGETALSDTITYNVAEFTGTGSRTATITVQELDDSGSILADGLSDTITITQVSQGVTFIVNATTNLTNATLQPPQNVVTGSPGDIIPVVFQVVSADGHSIEARNVTVTESDPNIRWLNNTQDEHNVNVHLEITIPSGGGTGSVNIAGTAILINSSRSYLVQFIDNVSNATLSATSHNFTGEPGTTQSFDLRITPETGYSLLPEDVTGVSTNSHITTLNARQDGASVVITINAEIQSTNETAMVTFTGSATDVLTPSIRFIPSTLEFNAQGGTMTTVAVFSDFARFPDVGLTFTTMAITGNRSADGGTPDADWIQGIVYGADGTNKVDVTVDTWPSTATATSRVARVTALNSASGVTASFTVRQSVNELLSITPIPAGFNGTVTALGGTGIGFRVDTNPLNRGWRITSPTTQNAAGLHVFDSADWLAVNSISAMGSTEVTATVAEWSADQDGSGNRRDFTIQFETVLTQEEIDAGNTPAVASFTFTQTDFVPRTITSSATTVSFDGNGGVNAGTGYTGTTAATFQLTLFPADSVFAAPPFQEVNIINNNSQRFVSVNGPTGVPGMPGTYDVTIDVTPLSVGRSFRSSQLVFQLGQPGTTTQAIVNVNQSQ